jgi:DNA-binding GntR family transcriptional regulator
MKKPVSKNAVSSLGRSSLGLGAIQRETLNDRVYQQLRTMIMSGAVSPGKELKLRELAKELHVSLMPVRDAIGRLVVERALEMLPNRQVIVPELSLDRLLEVLRVRVVLESEAGALAAGHATSGLVDSLKLLQKKIAAPTLSKQQEFFALNREFHFAIYQAAQSPLLFSMIEQLWLQIGPVFSHTSMDYVSGGADAHEKIIAALVARDADATRAAIAEDLTKGGERFAAALAGAQ